MEEGSYDLFLSIKGVNDLVPAGSFRIDDGSEEIKCGMNWEVGQIAEVGELVEAIRKDSEALGIPFAGFLSCVRYVPFMRLGQLNPTKEDLKFFNEAAAKYRFE